MHICVNALLINSRFSGAHFVERKGLKRGWQLPAEATGIFLVVGCAVGGGLLSLPIIASGMWFGYATALILATCFLMGSSSLLILESNLHFPPGASFDTVVSGVLGRKWNIVNGLSLAFVLYILSYAYISAGSSILARFAGTSMPGWAASILFVVPLAGLVWWGTLQVGRATGIILAAMLASFVLSTVNLSLAAEFRPLFYSTKMVGEPHKFIYLFAAIPVFLVSFGYHGVIPSLTKFYQGNGRRVALCIIIGCVIISLVYLVWLAVVFGNVSRLQFVDIVQAGGNVGDLSNALQQTSRKEAELSLFDVFANFAVISSFLAVTQGLFDYIADLFDFDDSNQGRLKSALVTFSPPLLLASIFPDGFIYAIAYAGLAAAIWGALVPALVARSARLQYPNASFRVPGGDGLCFLLIGYATMVVACHLLGMFGVLPVYGR